MEISITKRFARNGKADENDTRQIKKALNRLGYYMPAAKQGITEIPDNKVFVALRKFQAEYGLPVTGVIKPGDETDRVLQREAGKDKSGYYIWRTVEDNRVRPDHAALNGMPRSWEDTPDPGEDFNCRCWAESVPEDVEDALKTVAERLQEFKKNGRILSYKLFHHYLENKGIPIILGVDAFNNVSLIQKAIAINQWRFEHDFLGLNKQGHENSFYKQIMSLPDGESMQLADYWDIDLNRMDAIYDRDFQQAMGGVKLKSIGHFNVRRSGNIILVQSNIVHSMDDVYDFNDDTLLDHHLFSKERLLAEKGYAKPFMVHWEKTQNVTGRIIIKNSEIGNFHFKWMDVGL